jgi:hypothetical protein
MANVMDSQTIIIVTGIGPNLAKTTILAKYNTVNQVHRLHGSAKTSSRGAGVGGA